MVSSPGDGVGLPHQLLVDEYSSGHNTVAALPPASVNTHIAGTDTSKTIWMVA
jgi:hypothetical protein